MALWKGLTPQILISLPSSTLLFGTYMQLRPELPPAGADRLQFYAGVFVAGFHAGVEWGIFTSDCTAASFDVGRFDPSALERPMATGACDKAPFVILGLSM